MKNKLLQDIINLSSKDEKPYAGLSQELEVDGRKISGDVATTAHDIILDSLSGAEADTLTGLKNRLERLMRLDQTLGSGNLEGEDNRIISSSIAKAKTALQAHIKEKQKKLNQLGSAVSKVSLNIGQTVQGMFNDDPLVNLAVKTGSFFKQKITKKLEEKREKQNTLKSDATKMYAASYGTDAQTTSIAPDEETELQPTQGFFTPPNVNDAAISGGLVQEKSVDYNGIGTSNTSEKEMMGVAADVRSIAKELLLVIDGLKPLEQIAKDVNALVRDTQLQRDKTEFDAAESALEANNITPTQIKSEKPEKQKSGLIGKLLPNFDAKKIAGDALSGLLKVVSGGTLSLIAGIGWAIADGISGFLKSEDWGVSKVSGFIGGFLGGTGDNQIIRALAGMGKFALIGAKMGSMVAPGPGTIVGGLIGALIGGMLGWIGGENIAGFFDEFGFWISDSFTNGFDMMKNFFSDMWNNSKSMIDKVLNIVDSIKLSVISWVKEIADWIPGAGSLIEKLDMEKEQIESRMKERNDNIQKREEESKKRKQELNKQREQQADAAGERQRLRDAKKSENQSTESMSATPAESMSGQNLSNLSTQNYTMSKNDMKSKILDELNQSGITDPRAQANILANLEAESNFTPQSENLNYSAKTLLRLFGPGSGNKVRVRNLQEAQAIVDQGPEAIGNLIYGGRMGNKANEGYKYRGRGVVQLTGKDNYAAMGKKLGIDLEENPDLVNNPEIAAKVAAIYYADRSKKFNLSDARETVRATGHAAGETETQKRILKSDAFLSEINSGKLIATSSDSKKSTPEILMPDDIVQTPKNYQMVAEKSAAQKSETSVVNVVNNSTGGAQVIPAPSSTPTQQSNGTSSRRSSYTRGWDLA